FTDANNGTAVGESGTIVRTTAEGNTWVPQTNRTKYDLRGVSFTDANTGTAVGGTPLVDEGIILRTTDGGNTWVPQSNPGVFLSDVSFSDANNGTAVGDRGNNPENHRWWKQLGTSNKRDYHVAIWRFVHRCEQRDDCRIRIIWRPRYNSQNNGWRRPLGLTELPLAPAGRESLLCGIVYRCKYWNNCWPGWHNSSDDQWRRAMEQPANGYIQLSVWSVVYRCEDGNCRGLRESGRHDPQNDRWR